MPQSMDIAGPAVKRMDALHFRYGSVASTKQIKIDRRVGCA